MSRATFLIWQATAPIDEDRISDLLAELDPKRTGTITLKEFSRWMAQTYASYLERPSLAPDSIVKIPSLQQLHSSRLSRVPRGFTSAFEHREGGVDDPWPR